MSEHNQSLQDREFTDNGDLLPFLKRIFKYALSYPKIFWTFVVAVGVVALSDAAFPLIWMYYLDSALIPLSDSYKLLTEQGTPFSVDMSVLWLFAGLFALSGFIQVVAVYFFIKAAGFIEEKVMYDLREAMFNKLQELSFSYYDKAATGWLLSRISSDAERVTKLISWGFLDVVWGFTMIFACIIAMLYYNWQLATIVIVSIPILVFLSIKIRLLILKFSRKARKINSELTASYTEHINGVEVNKITAQETRVSTEFGGLSNSMRSASFKAAFYSAMYMPLVIFIGSVASGLILFYGGKMAITVPAAITVGTLTAFFAYATRIFWPILDIAGFYAMAQGCLSAGERIFSLIDEIPSLRDRENATDFDTIKGEIQFENVDFSYVENKPVLKNFNLHIRAGESIAIVGATGGGKSTIINLICRFYEPTNGKIIIDGEDFMDKTKASLRKQLGVVLQTPHLFSGSMRENIRYGRLDATEDDIKQALISIGALDFIERLEEEVGDNGDNLSMGEKQLVSFARAILAQPRIIIMDEATSSVDTLTEAKIQEGIDQMIEGRTAIIIAHRLSTIKNCDRILVLKAGKIVEEGEHAVLMKMKGYYHSLYTKQRKREKTADLGSTATTS